ncbi:MAG: hypothetical protein ACFE85_08260 [Candidatus Hodarchaeota archaeon]
MSSNIKIFKLNYSGSFEEIPQENLLDHFTLFDIITFYNPTLKRLYIWIGKKASQTLKSHIPRVREIFSEQYPELNILRNITIESGFESAELLDLIGISETKIKNHIKNLEIRLLPSLSEINRLKETIDKKFLSEDYEEAIKLAKNILKLAQEIDDVSLEIDQKNFINEAQTRLKAKNLHQEIEKDCLNALNEFQKLASIDKNKEAHYVVSKLKKKYDNDINLYSIPVFQDLILKDENLLNVLRTEQTNLYNQLDDLEIQYNRYLNENYLEKADATLKKAKLLVNQIIEEEISKKWIFLESKLKEAKEAFINRIEKLSKNALNYLDKGKISNSLEMFEKIIFELDKNIEAK